MNRSTLIQQTALAALLVAFTACLDDATSSSSSDSSENAESKPLAETLASDSALGYHAFDLVIRDFPVTHPDFENFQQEASGKSPWSDWSYSGYKDNST